MCTHLESLTPKGNPTLKELGARLLHEPTGAGRDAEAAYSTANCLPQRAAKAVAGVTQLPGTVGQGLKPLNASAAGQFLRRLATSVTTILLTMALVLWRLY